MDQMGIIPAIDKVRIAVIGLGYVGLPLAVEFSKKYQVIGFDIKRDRVCDLNQGFDHTGEVSASDLKDCIVAGGGEGDCGLVLTSDKEKLGDCNMFIVTVPTPVDQFKAPDLKPLLEATAMIGGILKRGDLVVYESTVYPGCTEDDCVPVLEAASGLKFNIDFFAGYSPERINPGDKINTLTKIVKVTSGSTPGAALRVDNLYRSIIQAGTHLAPSIKVAEASKAIENAQRDLNISFVNELSLIFDRIGIDTADVIEAAGTKWNFLKYKPGLVGGHCIGVDPYYLAHKAQSLGYHPQVILSGRRVNDMMGQFVANKVVKLMIAKDHKIKGARALIMGITFKENCSDVRNTRVIDIFRELRQFGLEVDVYDPKANKEEVGNEYGIQILKEPDPSVGYQAVIIAVAHDEFRNFDYDQVRRKNGVIFDTKGLLARQQVDARL
ncbi:nucleotide sugar dehydrogenase [Pararcticibacter amylolyticus]|uniref:nucleotide sugar dehydrogenase n=1 Tax=Pararcticibacter amylolyticus TaxID=2173175 RepID=UPI0026B5FDBB|nr:nucleotide sugar dehydrogenase [Pararcticibacter amylolyticus]